MDGIRLEVDVLAGNEVADSGEGNATDDDEVEGERDRAKGVGVADRKEWLWLGCVGVLGSGRMIWNSLFSIPKLRG